MKTKFTHLEEIKLRKGMSVTVTSHKRNYQNIFVGTVVSNKKKGDGFILELEVETMTSKYMDNSANQFSYPDIEINEK